MRLTSSVCYLLNEAIHLRVLSVGERGGRSGVIRDGIRERAAGRDMGGL